MSNPVNPFLQASTAVRPLFGTVSSVINAVLPTPAPALDADELGAPEPVDSANLGREATVLLTLPAFLGYIA